MIYSSALQAHPSSKTRLPRWLVMVPALLLPLFASVFYFVLFPGTTFGNSFYTGIKVWLILAPLVVTTVIFQERLVRTSPTRGEIRRSLVIGAAFGILVLGFKLGLMAWTPLGVWVEAGGANIREATDGLGVGGTKFLYFALFVSLIHSAMEEFYWRWFVYGNLRHMVNGRLWIAHLIAGVGFMAHHIVIVDRFFDLPFAIGLGICVGIGGIFWSWLYERTRTLWGAWLSHAIVDFGIFWVGYRLMQGG